MEKPATKWRQEKNGVLWSVRYGKPICIVVLESETFGIEAKNMTPLGFQSLSSVSRF